MGTREIPDKLYFRIGEVAMLCGVPTYVLRFWESEFPQLKPSKGGTGQRLYRRRDVELALRIKTLLYDEGYTIAGARQALRSEQRQGAPQLALGIEEVPGKSELRTLRHLRKELQDLHDLLLDATGQRQTAPVLSIRAARRRPQRRFSGVEQLFQEAAKEPEPSLLGDDGWSLERDPADVDGIER